MLLPSTLEKKKKRDYISSDTAFVSESGLQSGVSACFIALFHLVYTTD